MTDANRILSSIKVSEKRLKHTMGVAVCAKELAQTHFPSLDLNTVELAALMHDYTKEFSPEKQFELCEFYGIELTEEEKLAPKLLHGKTAAAIASHQFGLPKDACSAIYYHTTGRAGMTLLEKLLYVADYVDPTRDYEDVDFYRKLAFADIDRAAFLCLAYTMEDLSGNKGFIHKDTYDAYQYYVRYYEDNPDKKFDENSLRI
jgi:nicotinate-nucleotide adenylyltransferase